MMNTHKKVESKMDAAVIRQVMPRETVKRLARLMAVPLGTAHEWVYRNLSAARRRELAVALLAEMDRQDQSRAAIRQRLEQVVTDHEMGGAGGGVAVDETRRAEDRSKVG